MQTYREHQIELDRYYDEYAVSWRTQEITKEKLTELLVYRWSNNAPYHDAIFCKLDREGVTWSEQLQFELVQMRSKSAQFSDIHEKFEKVLIDSMKNAFNLIKPTMSLGSTWFMDVLALRRCTYMNAEVYEIIERCADVLFQAFPTSDPRTLTAFSECYKELAYAVVGEISAEKLITASFRSAETKFPWGTASVYRSLAAITPTYNVAEMRHVIKRLLELCDRLFFSIASIYANEPKSALKGPWSTDHLGAWHILFDESLLLSCAGVSLHESVANKLLRDLSKENSERKHMLVMELGWEFSVGGAIYIADCTAETHVEILKKEAKNEDFDDCAEESLMLIEQIGLNSNIK